MTIFLEFEQSCLLILIMDEKTGYTITKATLTILIKYTIDHTISLRKDQQWQKQPKMTVSIPSCKQKQT